MTSPAWMNQVLPTRFDNDILPFWEGLTRHEFLLHRCKLCGQHYWPSAFCAKNHPHPAMLTEGMEWVATSGKGAIFTYGIVHQVPNPLLKTEVPYAIVLIELNEGPIFPTRLAGHAPKGLRIGMPVEIMYHDVQETSMTLPLFKLSE